VPVDSPKLSPWSDDEVERLLRLIESGSNLTELSRSLGRHERDIESEASFLGVMVPCHEELSVQTRTVDSCSVSATIHYAPFNPVGRRIAA
jgi:hypothetical protein